MQTECVPVLLLGFNRPDCVAQLVSALRIVKPKKLYIAIDGPRDGNIGDVVACAATLAEFQKIDWTESIQWLIRKDNLGCGRAVSEAITWFFSHVEQGVILEDDCIPEADFLSFASRLLNIYRDDERVSTITGDAFLPEIVHSTHPFWFSKYAQIWGWATWRRAWVEYDFSLDSMSYDQWVNLIRERNPNPQEQVFWLQILDDLKSGDLDTWDYQLTFSAWKKNRLHITPVVNLVTNVGFREDATHTKHASQLHGATTGTISIDTLVFADVIETPELDDLVFYRRWLESLRFTWWIEKPIAAKYEEIISLNRLLTENAENHDAQLQSLSDAITAERQAFRERIEFLENALIREQNKTRIQHLKEAFMKK